MKGQAAPGYACTRRAWLAAAAAAPLAACSMRDQTHYVGGWVGAQVERGHRLRDRKSGTWPEPAVQRRASVVIVGAGVAGLAAARALTLGGIDDVQLLELEDAPGGNSRGHVMAGMACPLGAHYLPLPADDATDVIELLEALGLRRSEHGRAVYDERHLCHSPQERLHIDGQWVDGLLPPPEALPAEQRGPTRTQYRRFADAVTALALPGAFTLPTARARWSPALQALDAVTFAQWLDRQGYTAPALRWYLDYCCRDDYGAGAAQVSAWAGIHYFASRHGFHAPDEAGAASGSDEHDAVLTWPEGNGWLTRQLAAPLAGRLHTGRSVWRVREARHAVEIDAWDEAGRRSERWTAQHVVLAMPLFIAARLLESPPDALQRAAAHGRQAPWLVANLHLDAALRDRPGAAPAWDNVNYDPAGSASLGYVDAMHQSLRPYAGPTVLTAYWALGDDAAVQRRRLLDTPWSAWAQAVLQDLARLHPDLPGKLRQVDLMRYGHAMAMPLPGRRSDAALQALAMLPGRIAHAHSDLSAYSVFEEAYGQGLRAARQVLRVRGASA